MADDDVTIRIRVAGGPMPGGWLDQDMRDHHVLVVSRASEVEGRDAVAAMEAVAAAGDLVVLVVTGSRVAIRAAMAAWRKRFPDTDVEAEDDEGTPIGYL